MLGLKNLLSLKRSGSICTCANTVLMLEAWGDVGAGVCTHEEAEGGMGAFGRDGRIGVL